MGMRELTPRPLLVATAAGLDRIQSRHSAALLDGADAFERLAAEFVGVALRAVPDSIASLVFASPLCARSTDLSKLWHPGYRDRRRLRTALVLWLAQFRAVAKGLIRLLFQRRAYGVALYGRIADRLLVVSSVCGRESADGCFTTSYVPTSEDDAVMVFGPMSDLGARARRCEAFEMGEQVRITWRLLSAGFAAARQVSERRARYLLLLQWTAWVVGLDWYSLAILERSLDQIVSGSGVTKVACAHEMHAYARVVWRVASKHGARTFTLLHAPLSRGKTWYYTYEPERAAGLALPDVFYVYDEWTADQLRASYPGTRFALGCSHRYEEWRTVREPTNDRRYYLFVPGLGRYDNTVVINALGALLDRGDVLPIRVRLHASADLSIGQKQWIARMRARGRLDVSDGASLVDDLAGARAVIGMGSSVLYQALLLARPVVQLIDEDYLPALEVNDLPGAMQSLWSSVDAGTLKACEQLAPDRDAARTRLGLDQPLVTYDRLFEGAPAEASRAAGGRA